MKTTLNHQSPGYPWLTPCHIRHHVTERGLPRREIVRQTCHHAASQQGTFTDHLGIHNPERQFFLKFSRKWWDIMDASWFLYLEFSGQVGIYWVYVSIFCKHIYIHANFLERLLYSTIGWPFGWLTMVHFSLLGVIQHLAIFDTKKGWFAPKDGWPWGCFWNFRRSTIMGTLTNQAPSSGSGPSIFPVLQKLFFFFLSGHHRHKPDTCTHKRNQL